MMMNLPVVVWSNRTMKEMQLEYICSNIVASHDSSTYTMVCGTKNGALLMYRSNSSALKWELECLMLRHTTEVVGIAMGINAWGDDICVSLGVDGAVGVWLLRDGRCVAWKSFLASELAPLSGIQMFCNHRYAILYGQQGRMLILDTWKCSILDCIGTGFEQVRRDVGFGECLHTRDKSPKIDSKVVSLGLEGLCKMYNWSQPIPTTNNSDLISSTSYLWQEESSWIISWAQDTLDMSCIHTQINPQTAFVPFSHFPIKVYFSPNSLLVLFIWRSKWAVFHRAWLEPSSESPTQLTTFCPECPSDTEWSDGCFIDNHTVMLWTTENAIYSFSAIMPDDSKAHLGQVFIFKPQENAELPQSAAFPLASIDLSSPIHTIAACNCTISPFEQSHGQIHCLNTNDKEVITVFVGKCGCLVLSNSRKKSSHLTPEPICLSFKNDSNEATIAASHLIMDHGTTGPLKTPILIHGYKNGSMQLHHFNASIPLALKDASSPVTCLAHLCVTRAVKPTTELYESYADSPTQSMGFQAAKLTKISHILHKLQHHSLTPRAHHVTHPVSTPTPPKAPSPVAQTKEDHANLFLIFTGFSNGRMVVSQVEMNESVSWKPVHSFERHVDAIKSIHVSPLSLNFGTIVATVGNDRTMSLYSVRMDDRNAHFNFLMDCTGHADQIVKVEWAFQTNHVFVECQDGMMYVWSITTGILERIVPKIMVHCTPSNTSTKLSIPNLHLFPCPVKDFGEHLTTGQSLKHSLLAYLHTWDDDQQLDAMVQEKLGLIKPYLTYSIAITGSQDALTLPIPQTKQPHAAKWLYSPQSTAQLALALVTLFTSAMEASSQEEQVLWSQLITHIAVVLPEKLHGFKEPSLEALADFGFDPWEASQMASRLLLYGVIKRLPENLRSTKAAAYMTKFQVELQHMEKQSGGWQNVPLETVISSLGSYLVVLSILGTCFPGEISPSCARQVCDILVACLHGPSHLAVVAAELLAKGLLLFRPHLTDVGQLVLQLIPLTLEEDVTKTRLKQAAMRLLVEVGTCEASFVLSVLQQEMNVSDRSITYREGVLVYLMTWVNLQFLVMVRHLPAVVDTVLTCLDPTKPDRRKKCLAMSTKCLHDLVKRFPMVDFHKATQRLAVGTMDGVILLYDLRMATKWRVLEGHTSSVGAVSFRKDGGMLISYGARESMIRWWNIGASGLFTLLKVQQSCVRHLQLAMIQGRPTEFHKVIQTYRFRQSADEANQNTVWLTREDESVLPLNFHI